MPRHRHLVDSFTLTTKPHTHKTIGYYGNGYIYNTPSSSSDNYRKDWETGEGGGGNTGTASPYTSYVGSGTAFNNMPPYLVVNIWKRLS